MNSNDGGKNLGTLREKQSVQQWQVKTRQVVQTT